MNASERNFQKLLEGKQLDETILDDEYLTVVNASLRPDFDRLNNTYMAIRSLAAEVGENTTRDMDAYIRIDLHRHYIVPLE